LKIGATNAANYAMLNAMISLQLRKLTPSPPGAPAISKRWNTC